MWNWHSPSIRKLLNWLHEDSRGRLQCSTFVHLRRDGVQQKAQELYPYSRVAKATNRSHAAGRAVSDLTHPKFMEVYQGQLHHHGGVKKATLTSLGGLIMHSRAVA